MGSTRWERQRAGGERRGAAAGPECGREERRWEEESPFNESRWNPMRERSEIAILNSEPCR